MTDQIVLPHDSAFVRAHHDESNRLLSRRCARGELHRLAPGIYVEEGTWRGWDGRRRHLAKIKAEALIRGGNIVVSHWSAAVLHGLPLLGEPDRVHALAPRAGGGRSDNRLQRHCLDVGETTIVDGLETTSPCLTAVHLASAARWIEAVMVADAVAARDSVGFRSAVDALPEFGRGVRRAKEVLEFADARSDSPGESASRASIRVAGLTAPELQVRFVDEHGAMIVDFWWPEFGVVGEFDGAVKYLRPEYTHGRSAGDVVIAEKKREDRIRRQVRRVVRWDFHTAVDPAALGALLRGAGVR